MDKTTHTPLTLNAIIGAEVTQSCGRWVITHPSNGAILGYYDSEQDARDALALSVTAVNYHERMVEAGKALAATAQDTTKDITGFEGAERLDAAIDTFRAILAELEAK